MRDDCHTGCGIWPFITGANDPLIPACSWHDSAYMKNSSQQQMGLTRKQIDDCFLRQMLLIAGSCSGLKLRAQMYYRIVRLLGSLWWEGKE